MSFRTKSPLAENLTSVMNAFISQDLSDQVTSAIYSKRNFLVDLFSLITSKFYIENFL